MTEQPLVSVLMTAYNREKYIAEAIESVLQSSYNNWELIIVDDCSIDSTVAIAKEYEKKDGRIRVFVNEKNLGDYRNRNKSASYARGEFLMYVDSDDKILKDGIGRCVFAMMNFSNSNFGIYSFGGEHESYEIDSRSALRKHFFEKPFLMVGPGGTIIRRKFFEEIKGYPEQFGPANDLYFNLKACSYSKVVMLPFDFLYYRSHEGQERNNHYSYLYNNYSYLKSALNELKLPITEIELKRLHNKNNRRFLVNILKYLFKTGNFKKTGEAFKKADFSLKDALTGIFH